jgi:hypothetical protein
MEQEPVGYLVVAQTESAMLDAVVFTTDRAEAHRIYENAQRLDDEVLAGLAGIHAQGVEPMRFTLMDVYDESRMYDVIATDAEKVREEA